MQHLLDPGSRCRRGRGRPERDARAAERRAGVRLEGRDADRVLVVHRAGPHVARRWPEHAARRRRRRDDARAQGPRVREGRSSARSRLGRVGGVRRLPDPSPGIDRRGRGQVDAHRRRHQGRHRGDDDRSAPALPDGRDRNAALPGDQRQRLRHEEQVRQPLRLPALARRRNQPRDRPDAGRQALCRLRLRRRRQGLGGITAGAGRARRRRPRSTRSAPSRR